MSEAEKSGDTVSEEAPGASAEAGEEASASDVVAPTEAPKTKRKKRKKRKKRDLDEPKEPKNELDADGRERPGFVLDFPSDPALDKLVRAFELGNYAYVRAHAPELAESAADTRVRDAAVELARRIEPDPLVKILLAMSVVLLALVSIWTYRAHGP